MQFDKKSPNLDTFKQKKNTRVTISFNLDFHNVNASVFRTLSYKMRHDTTRASARALPHCFFSVFSKLLLQLDEHF